MTEKENKLIRRMSEQDRFKTAVAIQTELAQNYNMQVTSRTFQNRLKLFGLINRTAKQKPLVSLKARIEFAKKHAKWTAENSKKVLFSDESKFNRMGSDEKQYVKRLQGDAFDPRCTTSTAQGKGRSVMVHGCFSGQGIGPLIKIKGILNSAGYCNLLKDFIYYHIAKKI